MNNLLKAGPLALVLAVVLLVAVVKHTGKSSEKPMAGPVKVDSNIIVDEKFDKAFLAADGESFSTDGQLTFQLYRGGTFIMDGQSGYAWEKSDSYRDVAVIRTTNPLPKTYKISVVVGGIDYDLDNIAGIPDDPEYSEGPSNENGCYLITITDVVPNGHHINTWWHQHRKLVLDVDNNVWGHGMPNPIFMVYFDKANMLVSYDGENNEWQNEWKKGVTYQKDHWYLVQLEKTDTQYIFSVSDDQGHLLKTASIDLSEVWHTEDQYPDYFAMGDPHENYYQGSMKIKSILITK